MTDTNELRKLLAAATPLPWAVSYGDDMWTVAQTKAEFHGRLLARRTAFDDGSAGGEYGASCTGATRDLIVAAVNALPALLDELDAAREAIRSKDRLLPSLIAEGVAGVIQAQKAEAEVERLRDMLARLCAAVEHSAPGYGVYEDWCDITDYDIDTLRERMDEAKALLAKHQETNQ
jgi:hypothetical protein